MLYIFSFVIGAAMGYIAGWITKTSVSSQIASAEARIHTRISEREVALRQLADSMEAKAKAEIARIEGKL